MISVQESFIYTGRAYGLAQQQVSMTGPKTTLAISGLWKRSQQSNISERAGHDLLKLAQLAIRAQEKVGETKVQHRVSGHISAKCSYIYVLEDLSWNYVDCPRTDLDFVFNYPLIAMTVLALAINMFTLVNIFSKVEFMNTKGKPKIISISENSAHDK